MSERGRSDDDTAAARPGAPRATRPDHNTPAASGPAQDPLLNAVLAGRYRVLEHLGHGATGDVYRVEDTQLREEVALKMLSRLSGHEALLERFREEVRVARRVTHRNVARTHDIGIEDGVPFLTMELIVGDSLRKRLKSSGALPPEQVTRIALELARGLAAAHEAGVIHRDLKPGNVMITPEGRVVIIDFGIALPVEEAALRNDVSGTLMFMAPEQLLGAPLSPAVDVYALGLIVFEMTAGLRPFRGVTTDERVRARLKQDAPALGSLARCDPALAQLVAECLARTPDARPRAGDVVERLARLQGTSADRDPDDTFIEGAPVPLSEPHICTVAVLPFRAAPADAFVAGSIAETLVDILSQTRGSRVLAASVSMRVPDGTDPRVAAHELHADVVIEGSVERENGGFALRARMIDAESGRVILSERAESHVGGFFGVQEGVARRVAETLRLGLSMHSYGEIPDEALTDYLSARASVRQGSRSRESVVVAQIDRCLALAPGFAPALALRAMALMRAWLLPQDDVRDWAREAEEAVATAIRTSPAIPETWLAASMLALQQERGAEAVRALGRALELAPTCAPAHEALGRLYLETGRIEEGARHARTAAAIDPRCMPALITLARAAALRGRMDAYRRIVARLAHVLGPEDPESLLLRLRVALWQRDRAAFDALVSDARMRLASMAVVGPFARAAVDPSDAALRELADAAGTLAPRRRAFLHQLLAELAATDAPDRALEHVTEAARLGLLDTEWVEHCPLFDALRADPRWRAARTVVFTRADSLLSS